MYNVVSIKIIYLWFQNLNGKNPLRNCHLSSFDAEEKKYIHSDVKRLKKHRLFFQLSICMSLDFLQLCRQGYLWQQIECWSR
jgi:hypothetical protein